MKDLTIIIPSFNASGRLAETLDSIRAQSSELNFEVLICDNNSTDSTPQVVSNFHDLPISFFSEPDTGMYAALANSLRRASGRYHCYINCGDIFDTSFFSVVYHCLSNISPCWYIGLPASRDELGHLTGIRSLFFTSRKLILAGFHNGFYDHFLQQESIFWHHRLSSELDLNVLPTFRLAGDAYLWHSFALLVSPKTLSFSFSSYRHHPSPLSGNRKLYLSEYYTIYPRSIKPMFFLLFLLSKGLRAIESTHLLLLRMLCQ